VSTHSFSVLFALLALSCWVGVATVVGLAVARASRPDSTAALVYDAVAESALWLAWIVALVTTFGSLYYSEVAHFVPCKLCWYQRIAMYPLAVVLLVAAVRRDRSVWRYVVVPVVVGAGFAVYHSQLQWWPSQGSSFCTVTEPCTVRYVWEFGFVSLPFMALSAFTFIVTMTVVIWRAERAAGADPHSDPMLARPDLDDDAPLLSRPATVSRP
jgi:disulfide bond formation protein DsbB